MRIFTRYILKEILSHALIGAALFTFVVFMHDVGRILELVVRQSAPLAAVIEIFAYLFPTALTLTIPMGALVGVLLGLSRLAADSEITAMRACGISSWQFVRIVAVFAIATWGLALFNNTYLAPHSAAALDHLQERLRASQVSFEVQPRVFYEESRDIVLYVEDVAAGRGAAEWRNIFLADISSPSDPKITLAQRGVVTQSAPNELRLHLENGAEHEVSSARADQYQISTFAQSDVPISLPATNEAKSPSAANAEIYTSDLRRLALAADPAHARLYLIEFHRRLALPTAVLVLSLIGVPLGLSARKGGKATGFVLSIVLVFVYYFITLLGGALARPGRIPPGVGVWLANAIYCVLGLWLLARVDQRPLDAAAWAKTSFANVAHWLGGKLRARRSRAREATLQAPRSFATRPRFPQILDNYIVRDFLGYAAMVLGTFVTLMLVFTFFELLSDILRNRVGINIVGEYLLDVIPSMVYLLAPLSVLVGVLVSFGLMSRSNELTAMKATGISIYRVLVPVIFIAAVAVAGLFTVDQLYLPRINRRQETLRNRIKGKPPQTYLSPGSKWIVGDHHDIYHYQAFDPGPERPAFANITVFEFDPQTFQLLRRVYATRAHWEPDLNKWVFEQGWQRQFQGAAIAGFQRFDATTFAELNEPPAYFRKEVKQSQEMSYGELKNYIHDLEQSGFDVVRLRVQLQKKLAYPMITLVMAVLAFPFSISAGRRGALTGVATAIGIAIVYWVAAGLFEAMGNVNQLPPVLAAWTPDVLFAIGAAYLLLKVPT